MQIYLIKNLINNKIYVGKTIGSLDDRWKDHVYKAKTSKANMPIYRAINKYGSTNFTISTLEKVENKNILSEREIFWILKLKSNNLAIGYNISLKMSELFKKNIKLKKTKKYRGISKYKDGFIVDIRVNYKKIFSKKFNDEKSAAEAYDKVSLYLRKENVFFLNFPKNKKLYLKQNLKNFYNNFFIRRKKYSKYIGVTFHKKQKEWVSRYKSILIGNFKDEYSAAIARDNFIKKNNLQHSTKLNFI